MLEPVIEPGSGVTHRLESENTTVCGMDAESWQRRVFEMMLIVKCAPCWGEEGKYLITWVEKTPDGMFTSGEHRV